MLRFLLQLFFPQSCVHCNASYYPLCTQCQEDWKKEERRPPNYVPSSPSLLKWITSPYYLGPITQKLIHKGKYKGQHTIFAWIGGHIGKEHLFLQNGKTALSPKECILVPIPLHKKRRQERGFNQTEILAHTLGRACNVPVHSLLKRTRHTTPQAKLTREERQKNLIDAFAYLPQKEKCLDKTIIIVDDVTTTYSTLEEAAKVLSKQGYKNIIGWTIAHAPLAHSQKTS